MGTRSHTEQRALGPLLTREGSSVYGPTAPSACHHLLVNLGRQFAAFLMQQRLYSHSYVVKDGDTVESVAAALGITVEAIVRLNRLRPPYRLHAGQLLRVPSPVR